MTRHLSNAIAIAKEVKTKKKEKERKKERNGLSNLALKMLSSMSFRPDLWIYKDSY